MWTSKASRVRHSRERWLKPGIAVITSLLVMALVAFATPQYRNTILNVSCDRVEHDFGGGPGGRPGPDAVCDSGFVAVGFHVQTGEYYNQAWLDCAPIRSDGSLGEERRTTARTGSPGGQAIHDANCSGGRALRGLRGRTGSSIDEAVGECSYVRDMAERFEAPGTELTNAVTRPRPGGKPAEAQCPAGTVLTGFRTRSGAWMDHLSILCSDLQRSY